MRSCMDAGAGAPARRRDATAAEADSPASTRRWRAAGGRGGAARRRWHASRSTPPRHPVRAAKPCRERQPEVLDPMSPNVPLKNDFLLRQRCYVRGAWVDADDGKTIDVVNPATREVIGTIPRMGAAETRRAIEAADSAMAGWRKR